MCSHPLMIPISSATIPVSSCDTIHVSRQLKYITSQQLWSSQCYTMSMDGVEISFTAPDNLKIKLLMTQISGSSLVKSPKNSSYIIHGLSSKVTLLGNHDSSNEIEEDHATIVLSSDLRDTIFLIGFQGEDTQNYKISFFSSLEL